MFNLDFLSLKFTQQSYIVNENVAGGKQVIEVERCKPYCHSGSGNYTSFVEYQIGDGAVSGLPVILSNPKMYLRGDKCPYKEGCASTANGSRRLSCVVLAWKNVCGCHLMGNHTFCILRCVGAV